MANAMDTITLKYERGNRSFLEVLSLLINSKKCFIVDDSEVYDKDFLKKIEKSKEDVKKGRTTKINTKNVWKSV